MLLQMSNEAHHISVCICTYKRPQPLKHLLEELRGQDTGGRLPTRLWWSTTINRDLRSR